MIYTTPRPGNAFVIEGFEIGVMIMRKLHFIVFMCLTNLVVFAAEPNSIRIEHIGETDRMWEIIIINTRKDGFLLEDWVGHHYIGVRKPFFDEIVELIDNNRKIFGEKVWNNEYNLFDVPEYGSFELFVEHEGEEKYYFLVDRNASIFFFGKLLELIKTKRNYNQFISVMESLLRRINY